MQSTFIMMVLSAVPVLAQTTQSDSDAASQPTRAEGYSGHFKFAFGSGPPPEGYTQVSVDQVFLAGKWGFEPTTKPTLVDRGGDDALHSHLISGPFAFSVKV